MREEGKDKETIILYMSTVTGEGVMEVKQQACDILLASRVETKVQGKKVNDVLHRLHVAMPQKRDDKVRGSFWCPCLVM